MTHKHNGGAAFPIPLNAGESYNQHGPADGMTLRDYFAAKAMQGLMSIYWEVEDEFSTADELIKCHAETAYEYADTMLKARENKT